MYQRSKYYTLNSPGFSHQSVHINSYDCDIHKAFPSITSFTFFAPVMTKHHYLWVWSLLILSFSFSLSTCTSSSLDNDIMTMVLPCGVKLSPLPHYHAAGLTAARFARFESCISWFYFKIKDPLLLDFIRTVCFMTSYALHPVWLHTENCLPRTWLCFQLPTTWLQWFPSFWIWETGCINRTQTLSAVSVLT